MPYKIVFEFWVNNTATKLSQPQGRRQVGVKHPQIFRICIWNTTAYDV